MTELPEETIIDNIAEAIAGEDLTFAALLDEYGLRERRLVRQIDMLRRDLLEAQGNDKAVRSIERELNENLGRVAMCRLVMAEIATVVESEKTLSDRDGLNFTNSCNEYAKWRSG